MARIWRSTGEGLALVITVAGIAALDTFLSLAGPPTTGWAGPYAGWLLQLVVDISVLWLVRFPLGVTVFATVVGVLMLGSDVFVAGLLVPTEPLTLATVPTITPIIVGNVVRIADRRIALALVGVLLLLASRIWDPSWAVTPFGVLTIAAPVLAGLYFEARRQLVRSLRDRAERAEREQHLLAEQARAHERRRLAAEMHDVVTHRLSRVVLQAGALGVSTRDETTREAAENIRTAGTLALDELRDLLGVLHDGQPQSSPRRSAPSHDSRAEVTTLVAESETAGMPVELIVHGDAALAPTVARTVYRVVQEALTNVAKHAPGARVTVELRYRDIEVRVGVANTAPTKSTDRQLAASGSGTGLNGLRQRVGLLGGRLSAHPTSNGGYAVNAILPIYVPTADAESGQDDLGGRCR